VEPLVATTEGDRLGGRIHIARLEDGLSDRPQLSDGVINLDVTHLQKSGQPELQGQVDLGHPGRDQCRQAP
jgi:hypothetical protein